MESQNQSVPVRIYQHEDKILLAAPMAGLEPQDISVTIAGSLVTIRGEERGPRQHERDLLVDEWRIGPYYREITLPDAVDGALTNATYGNGVLVLSMPKERQGRPVSNVDFQLHPVEATRGERIGYSGSEMRPTTTLEHIKKHTRQEPSA